MQNGSYYTIERNIQIYPMVHHQYAYLLMFKYIDSSLNNYTLKAQFKDVRMGKFKLAENNYSVTLKGFEKENSKIIIKPIEIADDISTPIQLNYTYKNNDTIKFPNAMYKITVQNDLNVISLYKLKASPTVIYGYRKDDITRFLGNLVCTLSKNNSCC